LKEIPIYSQRSKKFPELQDGDSGFATSTDRCIKIHGVRQANDCGSKYLSELEELVILGNMLRNLTEKKKLTIDLLFRSGGAGLNYKILPHKIQLVAKI
jgi:hypothetical protein